MAVVLELRTCGYYCMIAVGRRCIDGAVAWVSWKTSHSGLRGEVFVEDTDVLTLHTSRSTEHVRGEVAIINQA